MKKEYVNVYEGYIIVYKIVDLCVLYLFVNLSFVLLF